MKADIRLAGQIVRWFGPRGFGFVKADDGGPELFFHKSQMLSASHRPIEGARVFFELISDGRRAMSAGRIVVLRDETGREPR